MMRIKKFFLNWLALSFCASSLFAQYDPSSFSIPVQTLASLSVSDLTPTRILREQSRLEEKFKGWTRKPVPESRWVERAFGRTSTMTRAMSKIEKYGYVTCVFRASMSAPWKLSANRLRQLKGRPHYYSERRYRVHLFKDLELNFKSKDGKDIEHVMVFVPATNSDNLLETNHDKIAEAFMTDWIPGGKKSGRIEDKNVFVLDMAEAGERAAPYTAHYDVIRKPEGNRPVLEIRLELREVRKITFFANLRYLDWPKEVQDVAMACQ